ncbi:hypothetical protein ACIFQM_21195 [Paenibacillus sp. NRS-1782]|uniref:hypothetical protein n=1 Tax=unclassified Paenibacillus TaxID=185978 RepID=UPI003D267F52
MWQFKCFVYRGNDHDHRKTSAETKGWRRDTHLHEAFADPKVKGILTAIGGKASIRARNDMIDLEICE